jgi:Cd2+/Zn2+-exporting ATPase
MFGVAFIISGMTLSALGYITPIWAAATHTVSSLIVIFNSARLVRKGEELEHYRPEPAAPKPTLPSTPAPQPELAAKLA